MDTKRHLRNSEVTLKNTLGTLRTFLELFRTLRKPYKPYDKDFRAKSAALKHRNKVTFALLRLLSKPRYQE